MAKGIDCKYFHTYEDGEVFYQGTPSEYGHSDGLVTECKIKCIKNFKTDGGDTDC